MWLVVVLQQMECFQLVIMEDMAKEIVGKGIIHIAVLLDLEMRRVRLRLWGKYPRSQGLIQVERLTLARVWIWRLMMKALSTGLLLMRRWIGRRDVRKSLPKLIARFPGHQMAWLVQWLLRQVMLMLMRRLSLTQKRQQCCCPIPLGTISIRLLWR
jgi:hypothetical protein